MGLHIQQKWERQVIIKSMVLWKDLWKLFPSPGTQLSQLILFTCSQISIILISVTVPGNSVQSHYPNYEFLASELMQLNPNYTGKDCVSLFDDASPVNSSQPMQVSTYYHTRQACFCTNSNYECLEAIFLFSLAFSIFTSLKNPLWSGCYLCCASLTSAKFINEFPVTQ